MTESEQIEFLVERVGPHRSAESGPDVPWLFGDDAAWSGWLAPMYAVLAAPAAGRPFLRAPEPNEPIESACGYWSPLLHLLVYSLGWTRPGLGLFRWVEDGKPTRDRRLGLIRSIWDCDKQLDWFLGWLAAGHTEMPGSFLRLLTRPRSAEPVLYDRAWLEVARSTADRSMVPNPLSGGSDPLHLSTHIAGPMLAAPAGSVLLRSGRRERRAVLQLEKTAGWYRALHELGSELPDVGERSWRVDVHAKPAGWLGRFRRSRETGLWFSGRHATHLAGN